LWTQQPEMQVLFANLSPEDGGAIVEKLREMKVPYEIGAGGTSVLVPTAQVHDLRLSLAGQGLPHGGGVGFEIFDRTTVGMSDFTQKLNYRRALQGELARTISQMPEVERARVHLAVPERRLFASEQDKARASVVLSLRGGSTLAKGQIQGIVHLVASSVEGLQPQDVTIVDGHGRLLSDSAGDGPTRLSGSQLDYQRSFEKDIETRIQSMLERIVGTNKAVVRVSSVLDFRQVEMTEERYDPNGQVVRSEQRTQEKTAGINGVAGGVPGVASNVPSGEAEGGGSTSSTNAQTKNDTVNYEISRTVSRIIEPVGTLKKLSAAVLVDGTYEQAKAGEKGEETSRKYIPRTAEDMKRIEEIVKKAMGYSAERQDQVEVVNVPFGFDGEETGGAAAEAAAPSAVSSFAPYVRYGVGAVLFGLILMFVVKPLMTALTQPGPAGMASMSGMTVGQLEASMAGTGGGNMQVVDMARTDPQSTALVVQKWLGAPR
ncbi:MAG TPA: flagellar basal-body MS-ring/collar protein FliF, partial [Nitrospirales bacterium]|nr:flagellar basal-body MS-ring/collar protein FliF [Nitrospirales bacterium]